MENPRAIICLHDKFIAPKKGRENQVNPVIPLCSVYGVIREEIFSHFLFRFDAVSRIFRFASL